MLRRAGTPLATGCMLVISLALAGPRAGADAGPEGARAPAAAELTEPTPRRAVPDYDGRRAGPPSPAESAAWVPRVALFPVRLVVERFVRFPLGRLVRWAEEQEVPRRAIDFFRFGPDERLTLAPIWSYELGFRPNAGALFRARGFGASRHFLTATAAFGGRRWYAGRVADAFTPVGSRWKLLIEAEATSRPDRLYAGLGSQIDPAKISRYHALAIRAAFSARVRVRRQGSLAIATGYAFRRFDNDVGDRISVGDRLARGELAAPPPGFEDGYSVWFTELQVALDTRGALSEPSSGIRFETRARASIDVQAGPRAQSFALYGGALTGFIDLSGAGHVLELMVSAVFSDAFAGELPFTELPALSGSGPLPGFARAYLTGDSGAATSVAYNWPVSLGIDGRLSFALGNVFDGYLAGMAPDRLRMSTSFGLAVAVPGVQVAELALGFGTDEIGDGPNVESVRFLVGSTRAF